MNKPPFITFYSFKGGVGRTQAVANVGAQLASRGFRVLLIDFDLEAPGLTWLLDEPTPGVVDLLNDAKCKGAQADLFLLTPPDVLKTYSQVVTVPDALRHEEGSLRVMPAGRRGPSYGSTLQALNLGKLYEDGTGRPLIAHLKDTLQSTDELDFVLVDSRTGFSDESGICTRDLADGVLVLLGLNRQNREGTASFLTVLKETGRKPLSVAISPVPNGEDEAVEKAQDDIEVRLKEAWGRPVPVAVRIPYHPRLALSDELKFWPQGHPLGDAYRALFDEVMTLAGLQPDKLVQDVLDAAKKADLDATVRAFRMVGRLSPERVEGLAMADDIRTLVMRDNSDALHNALLALLPGHSWVINDLAAHLYIAKDVRAEAWLQVALKAAPQHPGILGNYANFLKNVRQDHDAAEEHYKRALDADPEGVNTLQNYAIFLTDVRKDHDAAEEHYKRALDADPEHTNTLGSYAIFLTEVRKDHNAAEEHYKRALDADPKHPNNLVNYANFLTDVRQDHEAAEEHYKRALDADPKHTNILGNYASFLTDVRQDHEAAEEYYKRALHVDPKNPNNLGNYAKQLLILRRFDDATTLLCRAWACRPNPDLKLEMSYYQWAFQLNGSAWTRLTALLSDGVRSPGWPLAACAEAAIANGHPEPKLVQAIAQVISDEAPFTTLDPFSTWAKHHS